MMLYWFQTIHWVSLGFYTFSDVHHVINHDTIDDIDKLIRANICHIVNVDLSESQWTRICVPIKSGGLVYDVAFLWHCLHFSFLCQALRPYKILSYFVLLDHLTIVIWLLLYNCPLVSSYEASKQVARDNNIK